MRTVLFSCPVKCLMLPEADDCSTFCRCCSPRLGVWFPHTVDCLHAYQQETVACSSSHFSHILVSMARLISKQFSD